MIDNPKSQGGCEGEAKRSEATLRAGAFPDALRRQLEAFDTVGWVLERSEPTAARGVQLTAAPDNRSRLFKRPLKSNCLVFQIKNNQKHRKKQRENERRCSLNQDHVLVI